MDLCKSHNSTKAMLCVFWGVMGGDQHQLCSIKLVETKRPPTPNDAPKSISIPNLFISPPMHLLLLTPSLNYFSTKSHQQTNGHFVLYMYIITPSHELKLKPLSLNPKPSNKYQIQTHSSLQETTTHLHTHTLLKTILAISHYP
jgi:hypothetical protein